MLDYSLAFMTFLTRSEWAVRSGGTSGVRSGPPPEYDFVTGNPYEMPLPGIAAALAKHSQPQHKDWFAYRTSETEARKAIAEILPGRAGTPFEADDVHMTNGAFGALTVGLRAIADPGDEVIIVTPCFFFYESIISGVGAVPVRVPARRPGFDLDLDAIRAAISPRTRAVLVNSPNNPTGRIYSRETLQKLAVLLDDETRRRGRRIYIMSDESFCRIVYDGRQYISPTQVYPYSLLAYTYGKTLLAPGERLGYLALPATMPAADRARFRDVVPIIQIATGWLYPNATLQYAIRDLDPLLIDIPHLQDNRDRLAAGLRDAGYEVNVSEGSFFMLVKSPLSDDNRFVEHLIKHEVFALPGYLMHVPGYFRLSLCVTTPAVVGAIPRFAAARKSLG